MEIDGLRNWLRKKGIDPGAPKVDLTARNEAMYSRRPDGVTWKEIGKEFKLSATTVSSICKRIEIKNERKAGRERES